MSTNEPFAVDPSADVGGLLEMKNFFTSPATIKTEEIELVARGHLQVGHGMLTFELEFEHELPNGESFDFSLRELLDWLPPADAQRIVNELDFDLLGFPMTCDFTREVMEVMTPYVKHFIDRQLRVFAAFEDFEV